MARPPAARSQARLEAPLYFFPVLFSPGRFTGRFLVKKSDGVKGGGGPPDFRHRAKKAMARLMLNPSKRVSIADAVRIQNRHGHPGLEVEVERTVSSPPSVCGVRRREGGAGAGVPRGEKGDGSRQATLLRSIALTLSKSKTVIQAWRRRWRTVSSPPPPVCGGVRRRGVKGGGGPPGGAMARLIVNPSSDVRSIAVTRSNKSKTMGLRVDSGASS